jgi:hypothetical protein
VKAAGRRGSSSERKSDKEMGSGSEKEKEKDKKLLEQLSPRKVKEPQERNLDPEWGQEGLTMPPLASLLKQHAAWSLLEIVAVLTIRRLIPVRQALSLLYLPEQGSDPFHPPIDREGL